ncbi:MAG: SDR family oxidoreductase [Deltaproteobacteria bacterium]|nr:SDR family oxidoreductase [Deltaproteobacteria bacterium]
MAHILITGGAGFIGSHLCGKYLLRGDRVTAVDSFLTGSEENVARFSENKNFTLIRHDVSEPFPEIDKTDFVLHFACPASPVDFTRVPLEILRVDSLGTFNALELAKKDGARFLLASTSEVYGDPLVHPQTEDYWGNVNPTGLRSCYDEAKRFAEAATMVYLRKYEVNTGIVRIFNTYGPRMRLDDGRVVPNFCGQALRNEPLTVYGDGKQTRSFCFVDDLVDGIMRLVDSNEHGPVNIGNPDEHTILDFAKFVVEAVPGTRSRIEFVPLKFTDDPKQRRPVIARAQKLLGWNGPKVTLKEGIAKTLDYFRARL